MRKLAACYPDFALRSCRPLQQGWDSVTLLINDGLVFRFARRPDVAVRLGREASLLPRLAEALPVAVPRFEYVCEDHSGGVRVVGYRVIAGASPLEIGVQPAHALELARQLAEFLSALHSFPMEEAARLGVPGGSADDWRREYTAFYAEVCEQVLPMLDAAEQSGVSALWEGYLADDANFAFAPALIHRDLGAEHILVDPDGRLSGVVDWGDASIGDPAIDFTGLYHGLGQQFAEQVLDHYRRPHEPSFWRRVRFYRDIIPFYEIRFGQLDGSLAHLARGLEQLRRQLKHA
jgi:aminoglycoside 2''-phosphotransferase